MIANAGLSEFWDAHTTIWMKLDFALVEVVFCRAPDKVVPWPRDTLWCCVTTPTTASFRCSISTRTCSTVSFRASSPRCPSSICWNSSTPSPASAWTPRFWIKDAPVSHWRRCWIGTPLYTQMTTELKNLLAGCDKENFIPYRQNCVKRRMFPENACIQLPFWGLWRSD